MTAGAMRVRGEHDEDVRWLGVTGSSIYRFWVRGPLGVARLMMD
jgi:hypothetical protein